MNATVTTLQIVICLAVPMTVLLAARRSQTRRGGHGGSDAGSWPGDSGYDGGDSGHHHHGGSDGHSGHSSDSGAGDSGSDGGGGGDKCCVCETAEAKLCLCRSTFRLVLRNKLAVWNCLKSEFFLLHPAVHFNI